jgi:hypothetical protein
MPNKLTRTTAAATGLAVVAMFAVSCSQTKEATKEVASSASSVASSATSAASSAASATTSSENFAAGTTTLYYPQQQGALFSIEAPSDWTVGKIDAVGDFGSLESPNGAVLQFRAQNYDTEDAASKEIESIVDSTMTYLQDNYTEINLDEPTKVTAGGQPGTELAGTGKDKDGNPVKFLSAIIVLSPTSLAEIWAAVFADGNNDLNAATAVLDSFKPATPQ